MSNTQPTYQSKRWYYFSKIMLVMRWLLVCAALLALAATIVSILNAPGLPPFLSAPAALIILKIAPPLMGLFLGVVMTKKSWLKAGKSIFKAGKFILGITSSPSETPSEHQTSSRSATENHSAKQWFYAGFGLTTTVATTVALVFFALPAAGFVLPALVTLITTSLTLWTWPKIKNNKNRQQAPVSITNPTEGRSEDTPQNTPVTPSDSNGVRSNNHLSITQDLQQQPLPPPQSLSASSTEQPGAPVPGAATTHKTPSSDLFASANTSHIDNQQQNASGNLPLNPCSEGYAPTLGGVKF